MLDRVERGSRYEHEAYGTVEVLDFEREVTAIEGAMVEETYYVSFEPIEGTRRVRERVDDFREVASDA